MNALVLAVLLAAEPEVAATKPEEFRLQVGGEVGFPFLLGVKASGTFFVNGKPRFDLDASWEPSVSLQSYSVAGAYHVLDSVFFVGVRLRAVQFEPPWARGPAVVFFGAGAELGLQFRVAEDRGVIHVALHGTLVPAQATNLSSILGITAGFSWAVFSGVP